MLITERTSDGRTIVRLHKDWHPDRISKSYTPPRPRYPISKDAWNIQTAFLRKQS